MMPAMLKTRVRFAGPIAAASIAGVVLAATIATAVHFARRPLFDIAATARTPLVLIAGKAQPIPAADYVYSPGGFVGGDVTVNSPGKVQVGATAPSASQGMFFSRGSATDTTMEWNEPTSSANGHVGTGGNNEFVNFVCRNHVTYDTTTNSAHSSCFDIAVDSTISAGAGTLENIGIAISGHGTGGSVSNYSIKSTDTNATFENDGPTVLGGPGQTSAVTLGNNVQRFTVPGTSSVVGEVDIGAQISTDGLALHTINTVTTSATSGIGVALNTTVNAGIRGGLLISREAGGIGSGNSAGVVVSGGAGFPFTTSAANELNIYSELGAPIVFGANAGFTKGMIFDTSDNLTVNGTVTIATGTGQPALFSTKRAASTDGRNLCAGGGCQSVALGGNSTTGSNNTAFGIDALSVVTTGRRNVSIGDKSLISAVDNADNVAIGYKALTLLATSGDDANVAIGSLAMEHANNGATRDIAIGYQALDALTTGFSNVAIGYASSAAITTGTDNIALGTQSLQVCTTGSFNVGIGPAALRNLTTGYANTAIGNHSGTGITTGFENTIIGAYVGDPASPALPATLQDMIILADGSGIEQDQVWLNPSAPTSLSHGTLGAKSSNTVGNVTGVGANTTVVLTFSQPFRNAAWCQAQLNTDTIGGQYIIVTNSKTAPTFSCFLAGVASNCNDFSYWCTGN